MAKYIDAEQLKRDLIDNRNFFPAIVAMAIEDAPAADVVEVKHGKWYRHDKKTHGDTCYHCSVCEKMPLTDCGMVWELTPYCPNCGAKMDGEHNER